MKESDINDIIIVILIGMLFMMSFAFGYKFANHTGEVEKTLNEAKQKIQLK